jgi:hypothetical protein
VPSAGFRFRSTSASIAVSAGRLVFLLRATTAIAPSKQADHPAANSCSGFVPVPGPPGMPCAARSATGLLRRGGSRRRPRCRPTWVRPHFRGANRASLRSGLEILEPGRRPRIDASLRALIRRMSIENMLWGAPRIHGELLRLGFAVAQSKRGPKRISKRYVFPVPRGALYRLNADPLRFRCRLASFGRRCCDGLLLRWVRRQ